MQIQFLGASGTVTGSRYLLTHRGRRLLVDCGLFQGVKELRLRNWQPLPVEPEDIDAVLLTHAHLDHSGFLPRLIATGFKGPVFCTSGTRELCSLLLPDSGHLLEEEAEFANRRGFSKHSPALPLYTEKDARAALTRLEPRGFDDPFTPWPGWTIRMTRAGHIIGAASARIEWDKGSILFSGDLGRTDDLLMRAPEPCAAADYVVLESTYGDRSHPAVDPLDELAQVVSRTAARGGMLIVPAFAVGRAQTLLHCLRQLKRAGRIPDVRVYLNSPMAADTTAIYHHHLDEHRLDAHECAALARSATIVNSVEESKRLNELDYPSIIVSASGMASGGRVLHHLKAYAPDERNTILFTGFQAAGTRGAVMVAGARQVKIHGAYVPVRAEVCQLASLSAHADQGQLLDWLAPQAHAKQIFVTHGEPVASDTLRLAIKEQYETPVVVPTYRDIFFL